MTPLLALSALVLIAMLEGWRRMGFELKNLFGNSIAIFFIAILFGALLAIAINNA